MDFSFSSGFGFGGRPLLRRPAGDNSVDLSPGISLRRRGFGGWHYHTLDLFAPGDLAVQPAVSVTGGLAVKLPLNGWFSLQAPDGISWGGTLPHAGGNMRGAYAVDLQTQPPFAATEVASGEGSFAAGTRNTASNMGAIAIGATNNVTGAFSCGALGTGNQVSGVYAGWAIGYNNQSSGGYGCTALGYASRADKRGQLALADGQFASAGDAQVSWLVARAALTSGAATQLFLDGLTHLTIPANTTWAGVARFVARTSTASGTINSSMQVRRFLLSRGSTAASTTLVSSATEGTDLASAGAAGWAPTLSADTTNGALLLQYTAANGVRVVCHVEISEVTHA